MKKAFFVITDKSNWGKAGTLKEAMKNAQVKTGVKYVIYILVLKEEATEEEADNLRKCYSVTGMGGIEFYDPSNKEDETYKADREMSKRLFVGWITDDSFSK
jgi:hypothetical protein